MLTMLPDIHFAMTLSSTIGGVDSCFSKVNFCFRLFRQTDFFLEYERRRKYLSDEIAKEFGLSNDYESMRKFLDSAEKISIPERLQYLVKEFEFWFIKSVQDCPKE